MNRSEQSDAARERQVRSPSKLEGDHIGTRNQEKLNKYTTRSNKMYGGDTNYNWQRFTKEDQELVWGWSVDKIKEETEKIKC